MDNKNSLNNTEKGNRPINGQRPVRTTNGQRPVRPNNGQKPVRPHFNNNSIEKVEHKNTNNVKHQVKEMTEQEQLEELNLTLINDKSYLQTEEDEPKKVKVDKTPEQKKKTKTIGITAGVLVGVVLAVIVVLKILGNGSDQHVEVIDLEEFKVGYPARSSYLSPKNFSSTSEKETDTTSEIKSRTSSLDNPLMLGEYSPINRIVNTKTADEDSYTDHDTTYYVGLSDVVYGYDSVKKYIDEYNNNSETVLKIPDKEEFYNSNKGLELVMYEVELYYTSDYPTNLSEGYVYSIPTVGIKAEGTVKETKNKDIASNYEDFIITEENAYSVPEFKPINIETDKIKVGEPYKLRWIAITPLEANKDNYIIKLHVVDNNISDEIIVEGQPVK